MTTTVVTDLTLASATADNVGGNLDSENPVLSSDGTKAVFVSHSNNLVEKDVTLNEINLYLKDIKIGRITLVNQTQAGKPVIGWLSAATMSDNGTKVVFLSQASNLVTGDTNGYGNIFVADLPTGKATLVSQALDGSPRQWAQFQSRNFRGRNEERLFQQCRQSGRWRRQRRCMPGLPPHAPPVAGNHVTRPWLSRRR